MLLRHPSLCSIRQEAIEKSTALSLSWMNDTLENNQAYGEVLVVQGIQQGMEEVKQQCRVHPVFGKSDANLVSEQLTCNSPQRCSLLEQRCLDRSIDKRIPRQQQFVGVIEVVREADQVCCN